MGKFNGVLLASDFDNTLVYTEPALLAGAPIPPLSQKNREALEYFMAEGGRFCVATGRALAAFQRFAPDIPMNAPCVICNGAALYDFATGEYLDYNLLDETALLRGQTLLDAFPTLAVEAYHIGNVVHAVRPNEYVRRHEHLTHVGTEETERLTDVPLPLGKLLFEDDHETLRAVRDRLVAEGWDSDYELIFSGKTLLEMTAKGADKGGMLLRLCQRLGIEPRNFYCMGDEANDLPMLRRAAEGFAPANCIPAIREEGFTIVCHAEQDAAAEVITILDRKY